MVLPLLVASPLDLGSVGRKRWKMGCYPEEGGSWVGVEAHLPRSWVRFRETMEEWDGTPFRGSSLPGRVYQILLGTVLHQKLHRTLLYQRLQMTVLRHSLHATVLLRDYFGLFFISHYIVLF